MTQSVSVCGIDPGASGALAMVASSGTLSVYDMPTINTKVGKKLKTVVNPATMAMLISDCYPCPEAVAVEKVGAMPGQGVTSMFNFGYAYGCAVAVPLAVGYKVLDVRPQAWKKFFGLIGTDKDEARKFAINRFGARHAPFFARKKDQGRADAALIALYALEQIVGCVSFEDQDNGNQ